ncbi:RodZ domain-containing protein [Chitinibacter sp. GC72]|uniref:RodZ domain-containing protein n=1 Tax=Chitinibacter sp. GC72 TaxID=1526917 RepID=UPI0012FC9242|nr:RodZ domain-containing protein [Chitinibacter sp. GC72]
MTEQLDNIPSAPFLPAGRQLRAAREACGLSIDDVAGQLKLAHRQIEALESEAFDELPSNLFIRGFVRNYARLVSIDAAPLLEYLAGVLPSEQVLEPTLSVYPQVESSSPSLGGEKSSFPLVVTMALLGIFLGVAAVYWYLQQPSNPDIALPEMPNPVALEASAASQLLVNDNAHVSASEVISSGVQALPASTPGVALASPAASGASTVIAASSVAQGALEVSVLTESDSWVQILDSRGNKVLSEIIRPGYERKVAGVPPFAVKIGNAPKTKLTLQGRPVDLSSYLKPGSDVVNMELK